MATKCTLRNFITFLLFSATSLISTIVWAQPYCTPSFINGCSLWKNQAIALDSINWSIGLDNCINYDYTGLSTTLTVGVPYNMQVTNGNWCGCGVWIDFNQDQSFDNGENLFHLYTANESNTYNFSITIPTSVPNGSYRMRVVAGWGTDCYAESNNGYGACGNYQYGNFDDFTVHIEGIPTGILQPATGQPMLKVSPNPFAGEVAVELKDFHDGDAATLQLMDVAGHILISKKMLHQQEMMNLERLASGMYLLRCEAGTNVQTIALLK